MTDPLPRSESPTRGPPASPAAWRNAARELLRRREAGLRVQLPAYFERATCVSFQMDGMPLRAEEFRASLLRGGGRACRTRAAQRCRNHVAILRRIELLLRRGQPLQPAHVIRWYISMACGLSGGGVADATLGRIDRIVSAVNSPRLRFWPAVKEVAALHVSLLSDPFVPGFNGILARFLLRFHMGRCGLPPVVFDPVHDREKLASTPKLEARLLELIAQSRDGNGMP